MSKAVSVSFPVIMLLFIGCAIARADDESGKIDTESLFGFLTGTDVGEINEKELESTTILRAGKRSGSYRALSQQLSLEYTPAEDLRLEVGVQRSYHQISGVADLDDVRRGAFQGLSLEIKYRLLRREHSLFGLAVLAEPQWNRVDEVTGQPVDQYGGEFALMIDKELLPNRIVAAFNLLYSAEAARSRTAGTWSRESTVGLGAGLMTRISPQLFVGGEARYLRAYDDLGFSSYDGHALFVGPNLFFKVADRWRVTAAWATQVAGGSVEEAGRLDLTNFERHQVKIRVGYEF